MTRPWMSALASILALLLLGLPGFAVDRTAPHPVRLRVFALFKIRQLQWKAARDCWLDIRSGGGSRLFPVTANDLLAIQVSSNGIQVERRNGAQVAERFETASPLIFRMPDPLRESEWQLEVPGKIRRYFSGTLEIRIQQGELSAVITEGLEQLAGEVAAAEMSRPLLPAALEAQTIVARTYLASQGSRHGAEGYDFCDTTHCQYTRGSRIPPQHRRAAENTRGLVIAYGGKPIPAYYSAVCGGETAPFPEPEREARGYAAIQVRCPSCTRTRVRPPGTGWDPSPFSGAANGHGLGLCQAGALELARQGQTRDRILQHFFPRCKLQPL